MIPLKAEFKDFPRISTSRKVAHAMWGYIWVRVSKSIRTSIIHFFWNPVGNSFFLSIFNERYGNI